MGKMTDDAQVMRELGARWADAKANLAAATANKSITRHGLREKIFTNAQAAGEKMTATRADDQAVASKEYEEACQAEVDAIRAECVASTEFTAARCTCGSTPKD